MTRRKKVGIRQLKNEATSILSEVREDETEYLVTRHGRPVALISPLSPEELDPDRAAEVAGRLKQLTRTARSVAAAAADVSAAAVVSRQRR